MNSWERGFEYDRIDIWMWYGDEWLEWALKWWKRKVKWKVVPKTRELSIEFDKSPVVKYKKLKLDAEKPKKQNILELQKLLTEVKIYSWKIDWNFSKVKKDLVNFQVTNNVISSERSPSAGYFWPRTYAALRKTYWGWIFKMKNNKLDEDVNLNEVTRKKLDKVSYKINNIIQNKYWSNSSSLALKYRRNLRKAIDIQTKKIKNNLRKKQLKYLKSII